MPLDFQRVDRIHARLLVRYGSRWAALYAAVEPELVKADWARCLDGIPDEAIVYALDSLPDDAPPNVAQFRRLCIAGMNRPADVPRLPLKGDPMPAEVRARLKAVADRLRISSPLPDAAREVA